MDLCFYAGSILQLLVSACVLSKAKSLIIVPKVLAEPDFVDLSLSGNSILAVTSLLPSVYDYAGAHNAINPAWFK